MLRSHSWLDAQASQSYSYKASYVINFLYYGSSPFVPEVYHKVGRNWCAKGEKDVPFEANAAVIKHLLSKRGGASPHRQQLDFECGLRKYQTQGQVQNLPRFDATPLYHRREPFGTVPALYRR